MQELLIWLQRMWSAGGTDMAIAGAIIVAGSVVIIAWIILPFALIGIKSRISQLTRAINFNTAEIRAMRNENAKRAKRAERRAE